MNDFDALVEKDFSPAVPPPAGSDFDTLLDSDFTPQGGSDFDSLLETDFQTPPGLTSQGGGLVDTPPPPAPDLLSGYMDKDFVQRIFDPAQPFIENSDGGRSTHRMATEVTETGDWMVFPTIVRENGKLRELGHESGEAMDYAMRTGEFIPFGKDKEAALSFGANGYKRGTPMDTNPVRPESSSWWRSNIVDPWKESGEQEKNEFALFDAFTGSKGTMGGFKDLVAGNYQFDQKQYDTAVASNRAFNERRAANTPDRNFFERIIPATVGSARRMLAGYWEGKEEAAVGAATGAGAAAVAGQLGPQVAIPEELVTVPIAALHGAKYGVTFGSAKYWAKSGFGEIASELADKNVDPAIIAKVAAVGGIAYAAAEFLVSEVPGFPAFLKANPVVSAAMKKTALNLAREYGKRVVVESVEETVQQFITDLSANLAADMQNSKAGKLLVEKVPIAEMMQRGATAFMESLGPSALMMAPGEIQIANQARKTSKAMDAAGLDPESTLRFEGKEKGRGKEPVIRNVEGDVIGQGDAALKQASMDEGVRREQFEEVKAHREQQLTQRNARNQVVQTLEGLGVADDVEVRRAWLDPNMPSEEKVARLNDLLAAKDQISQLTEVEKVQAAETVTQAVTEDPDLSERFDEVLGFEQEVYQLMRGGLTEEDAVETLFDEQDAAVQAEERAAIEGEQSLATRQEALVEEPVLPEVEPQINTEEPGTVLAEVSGLQTSENDTPASEATDNLRQQIESEGNGSPDLTLIDDPQLQASEAENLPPTAFAAIGDTQYEKRDGKWFEAVSGQRTRDIRLVRSLENEVATPKEHSRKRRKKAADEIRTEIDADPVLREVMENGGVLFKNTGTRHKGLGTSDVGDALPAMFRGGQSKKSRHAKLIAGYTGKNDSKGLPLDELVQVVNHALSATPGQDAAGNERFDENSLIEYLSGFGQKAEELLDGRRKLQEELDTERAGSELPQRAQSPIEEELPELFNGVKTRKKVSGKNQSKPDTPEGTIIDLPQELAESAKEEPTASSLEPTALVKNPLSIADGHEVNTDPSEAQKEAENYKKAHVEIDGFKISIENPQGSVRRGVGPDGKAWESEMKADYGYFKGTLGYDKDHVDVFIAPGYGGHGQTQTATDSAQPMVFVVNQVDSKSGKFDEHKVVFGAVTSDQAEKIYLSNYELGWKGGKNVVSMSQEAFKEWVYSDAPKQGAVKKSLKNVSRKGAESANEPNGNIVQAWDVGGGKVYVRQSDLDSDKVLIPMFTQKGKRREGERIHAENIQREKPTLHIVKNSEGAVIGHRALLKDAEKLGVDSGWFFSVEKEGGQTFKYDSKGNPVVNQPPVKERPAKPKKTLKKKASVGADLAVAESAMRGALEQMVKEGVGGNKTQAMMLFGEMIIRAETDANYRADFFTWFSGKRSTVALRELAADFDLFPDKLVHENAVDELDSATLRLDAEKKKLKKTLKKPAEKIEDLGKKIGGAILSVKEAPFSVSADDIDYDAAVRAYSSNTHSPEKRARLEQREYVDDITSVYEDLKGRVQPDQEAQLLEKVEEYRQRNLAKRREILSAQGRTANWAVVGPARFPTGRNKKALDSLDRKIGEFREWREKALRRMEKNLGLITGTISSDDADAVQKLEEKLGNLEKSQELMKAANRIIRSKKTDASKKETLAGLGLTADQIEEAMNPRFGNKPGFASYALSNNNTNIKRTRDRIDQLKKQRSEATTEETINGVRLVDNVEANRAQLFFDGKPSDEVRGKLKGRGFRWTPSVGAWQRQRSSNALGAAKRIIQDIEPIGGTLRERSKIGFGDASGLGFYSAVEQAVAWMKQETFGPDQLLGQLRKMPGIKQEELDDLGLVEWLETKKEATEVASSLIGTMPTAFQSTQANPRHVPVSEQGKERIPTRKSSQGKKPGKITKSEVLAFVRAGGVQLEEVEKSEATRSPKPGNIIHVDGMVDAHFDLDLLTAAERQRFSDIREFAADGNLEGKEVSDWKTLSEKAKATAGDAAAQARWHHGAGGSKFSNYVLPGGSNYREVLLTLPVYNELPPGYSIRRTSAMGTVVGPDGESIAHAFNDPTDAQLIRAARQAIIQKQIKAGVTYNSGHWDEPNVLAHVRLNDRTGPKGEKILFIEEIQSDWHQAGRKSGYVDPAKKVRMAELGRSEIVLSDRMVKLRGEIEEVSGRYTMRDVQARLDSEMDVLREQESALTDKIRALNEEGGATGVPNAPFKKSWAMLAFKRVLKQAVDGGYDAVAWTPGEVQNDRYDLSKQVDSIQWHENGDGSFNIGFKKDGYSHTGKNNAHRDELGEIVGKEVALKIIDASDNQDEVSGELSGLELKVGGDGMKGFYDKILPKAVQKYVKKFGGKVGTSDVSTSAGFKINDFNLWAERNGHNLDGITSEQESLLMDQWQEQEKGSYEVWNLPITDSMRGEVEKGQALYEKPRKLDPEQTKKYLEKRGVENGNAAKQLQTEWDEISNTSGAAYPTRESGVGDAVARALVSPDDPQAIAEALKSGLPVSSVVARFLNNETPNLDWKGMLVQTARDFASLLMPLRSPYVESVKVAYLDQHKRIISARIVSIGLIDTTLVDAQEIIRSMPEGTAGVILAHNHPSGDPTPSVDDIKISRKMRGALNLAGVRLFDHVVTNGGTYVSMRENGMTKLDDLNTAVESPLGDVSKRRLPPAMSSVEPWERVARRSLKVVADEDVLNGVTKALRQADGDYGHAVLVNSINAIVGFEKIPLDMDPEKGAALIMRSAAEMGGNAFFLDWPVTHDKPANGVFVNMVRDLAENEMGLPMIDFMTLEKPADNVMRDGTRANGFVVREPGFQPKKTRKIVQDTEAGGAARDAVLDLNVALAEYEEAYKETAPERKTLKKSVQAVAKETRSLKKKVEKAELKSLKTKDRLDKKLEAQHEKAKERLDKLKSEHKTRQENLKAAVREGKRTAADELKGQRGDINSKIRIVEEYIRHKSPAGGSDIMRIAAGKAHHELKKVLSPAKTETRQKYLQEAIGNIDRIFAEAQRRDTVQSIDDVLMNRLPTIGQNKVLQGGALMPEQHETLGFIREAWKIRQGWQNLDRIADLNDEFAGVNSKLELAALPDQDAFTEEDIKRLEENKDRLQRNIWAHETFGDINGGSRSLAHVIAASKELTELVETGRSLHRMEMQMFRAQKEMDQHGWHMQFTGGQGIASSALSRRKRNYDDKHNLVYRAFDTFDTMHQSWEWFLDKLSRLDAAGGILGGKLIRDYTRLVNSATEKKKTGIRKYEDQFHEKAAEIFGEKAGSILVKNTVREEKTGVFLYNDQGEMDEMPLSKNEAYKLWQWWQDESLRDSMKDNNYTAETMQQIKSFVGPEVAAWAKWQLEEFYPKYYHTINPVYKRLWHVNMPYHENYSPVYRYIAGKDKADMDVTGPSAARASMVNRSLKARTENRRDFEMIDGDRVLLGHIMEMEHFKAWALPMRLMNGVFRGSEVQAAVQQFHGKAAQRVMNQFLDDFVRGGVDQALVMRAADRFRARFVTAVIGAKLPIFIKQLASIPAYAMDIPLIDFAKGEAAFWKNPIKAFKILMESDFMIDRYRFGHDRDVILAMRSSVPRTLAGKKTVSDKLMILTKLGDGAAIVVGGYAAYHYHYNKTFGDHATKHKTALREFSSLSARTQQAGDVKDQGHFQRGSSLQKMFTMFSTSPISYYRSVSGAVRNAAHGRGSKAEAMKRVVIGHFLLPLVFQFIANGFRWDDEDQLRAALLGSFNKLFVAGELADAMLYTLISNDIRLASGLSQTPLGDVFADAIYAAGRLDRELEKGTFDMADMMFVSDKIATVAGKATGLPYEGIRNQVKGAKAAVEGKTDMPVRRTLGFTPYALDEDAAKKKKTFKRSL